MDRLATRVLRHRRTVLVLSLLLIAVFGAVGSGVTSQLKGGGFDDPHSPSSRAEKALQSQFGVHGANLILLVRATGAATVDSAVVAAPAEALAQQLAGEAGVRVQASYFSSSGPAAAALKSTDGREALILAYIAGTDDQARAAAKKLAVSYRRSTPNFAVLPGGYAVANSDITDQVTKDLAVAESIAIPATLVLLILAFGGVVAGLLPLMIGGASILGTFFALSVLARFTDVSIFALNLTTALGLGLGIDYALLIVNRFREELRPEVSPVAAAQATLRTAGRTVAFSAATVAFALAALLVFPLYFLRSFAYAGIAVVVISAAGALVLLPVVLGMLGHRVNNWALPWAGKTGQTAGAPSASWARIARVVMRRPVLVGVPIVVLLLAAAIPFGHVRWGLPDDRVISSQTTSRTVGDALRQDFAATSANDVNVLLSNVNATGRASAVADYARALSRIANVATVTAETGSYADGVLIAPAPAGRGVGSSSRLTVTPTVDPFSGPARKLVRDVRALPAPGSALVGGTAAALVDTLHSVGSALPAAAAIIVIASLIILFLFTGSVVLPVKALVMNALSLGSVMGVIVWVFQYGHGSTVLHFVPQPLSITMPLLLFCVAFGLSMDYEVFLLGRIKEQHDLGDSTVDAVAIGLARTGRIVTTAAALLSVTFLAFVTSKVSFIQLFGLGTGLAIIVDATLVRGLLVPAFMRLMGDWNWWAPAPLRRLYARFGVAETAVGVEPERVGASA